MPATATGYITRSNLPSPQGNLTIFIDPYWALVGDDQDAADSSVRNGIEPAQSALKMVWADSPFVAGKIPVLATPDNSTLNLRLIIDGTSMADAQSKIAPIIQAIRGQLSYQVSVTLDSATYTWLCYTGDYTVAFNQMHTFGYLVPMYLSLPRNPVPVAGPV
jgi:hypothetical protein